MFQERRKISHLSNLCFSVIQMMFCFPPQMLLYFSDTAWCEILQELKIHSVNAGFRESETVFTLSASHMPEKSLIMTQEQTYVQIWQQSTGKIISVPQNWSFSASVKIKFTTDLKRSIQTTVFISDKSDFSSVCYTWFQCLVLDWERVSWQIASVSCRLRLWSSINP